MRTETLTRFKRIYPADGKYLTQATLENEWERVFVEVACIPLTADTSSWTEWSEAQKTKWEQEHPEPTFEEEEEVEP